MAAMRWNLIKASSPSWEKEFDTKEELTEHLRDQWICRSCLEGGQKYLNEDGTTFDEEPPPDPNDLADLLSTPCGCEFWVEEIE